MTEDRGRSVRSDRTPRATRENAHLNPELGRPSLLGLVMHATVGLKTLRVKGLILQ
jgi:hypothetical protein